MTPQVMVFFDHFHIFGIRAAFYIFEKGPFFKVFSNPVGDFFLTIPLRFATLALIQCILATLTGLYFKKQPMSL